jgi:hypothetical protein
MAPNISDYAKQQKAPDRRQSDQELNAKPIKNLTMSNLQKTSGVNLISFRDGFQLAEINGTAYLFNFSENELADSIEANTLLNELSHRSGLHQDDYSEKEMAIEIASQWETSDVLQMIADLPGEELQDYRKEVSYAA